MPSSFRSKIQSGPVNRSWVSVAAIGSSQSGVMRYGYSPGAEAAIGRRSSRAGAARTRERTPVVPAVFCETPKQRRPSRLEQAAMNPTRSRVALSLVTVLTAAACAPADDAGAPAETWGFVATLGSDTTSVERITREGDRITGVAVGRSPLVVLRRWEATLAPDGSFSSWSMDTRIANAPEGAQELHHELEVSDGAIRVVRQIGSDTAAGRSTQEHRFAPAHPLTMPWNAYLYSTFESLIQAAEGIPDSTRLGIYFFEGWEEGRIGWAQLRRLPDGGIGVRSSGLSGEGVARVDSAGRMLSYSGEGTTYKQEVRRVADVPDLDALFERFAADERLRGVPRVLSARDTMRATLRGVGIVVDYGRPLARGRTLVGGIIPYDRVWRTGANAATQITFDAPVRLAGVPLDAGTYTLWTVPQREGVTLIINAQTGQWGTGYDVAHDIGRVPMQVDSTDAVVEQFTIRVDGAASRLLMEWGTFRWSAPIEPGALRLGAGRDASRGGTDVAQIRPMRLLLIRHGKAEDRDDFAKTGRPDDERPLTPAGQDEMRAVADGLAAAVPDVALIATSPLVRAMQTADAVARGYPDAIRETTDVLAPDAPFAAFVDWLQRHREHDAVAAVGHNPHLSELASWLTGGDDSIDMKKGSALLLELGQDAGAGSAQLVWYRTPKKLGAISE